MDVYLRFRISGEEDERMFDAFYHIIDNMPRWILNPKMSQPTDMVLKEIQKQSGDELKQMEEEAGRTFPDLEFEFAYDTENFLRYYENILTLTGLQKITGVHHKQLSHYATGQSRPTAKTVRRI